MFCFNTFSRICIRVLKDGQGRYHSHARAVSLQEKVFQAVICRSFLLINLYLQVIAVVCCKEQMYQSIVSTLWWLLKPSSYFWFVKHLSSVTREAYQAETYGFLFFFINVPLLVAKFCFINNTVYLVMLNKTQDRSLQ